MVSRRMRQQTKNFYLLKHIIIVVGSLLCLCFLIWKGTTISEEALPVASNLMARSDKEPFVLWPPKWRDVLFAGVPGLVNAMETHPVVSGKQVNHGKELLRDAIMLFTNVDIEDMRSLLQVEIPVLAAFKSPVQMVTAISLPDFPKFEMATSLPSGKPLVGIYHTHTAESFIPSSGAAHKPGGQQGDIVDVGGALAKRLATYGIATVHSTTVHDYPSFMKAYGASEITVTNMLAENPSLEMIFDIHRDAEKRENYTTIVNGIEVARMMIIVTTGQPGLIQPHWQQNYAFAKLIDAKMNQRYPGVSHGIRMDDWRYNQHLHPRALLIEVGCQENSKEEAERGIELLGDVIAEIITENNKP